MSSNKTLIFSVIGVVAIAAAGIGAWQYGLFGSSCEGLTVESKKIGSLEIDTAYEKYKTEMKEEPKLSIDQFKKVLFAYRIISKADDKIIKKLFEVKKESSKDLSEEEKKKQEEEKKKQEEEKKEEEKKTDEKVKKASEKNKKIVDEFFGASDKFESFVKTDSKLFNFTLKEEKIVPTEEQSKIVKENSESIETLEKSADKVVVEDLKKVLVEKNLVLGEEKLSLIQVVFANWVNYISA